MTKEITWELNAPHVKTYPIYGVKVDTPSRYIYDTDHDFNIVTKKIEYGNGDGTVPLRSLEAGNSWKDE